MLALLKAALLLLVFLASLLLKPGQPEVAVRRLARPAPGIAQGLSHFMAAEQVNPTLRDGNDF